MPSNVTIAIDSREPQPHPWPQFWPDNVLVIRETLETGDIVLAGAPAGAVIERKTVCDFLAAIGTERERFTKELLRARYLQSFCIVVEGTLLDVLRQTRGLHPAAILGSIAAWTRRGFPIVFAGNIETAATFALRCLGQPISEAQRLLAACERADQAREPAAAA
jgi:ERCC4-type nuclease